MTPEQITEMTSEINQALDAGNIPNATAITPMNGPQISEVDRLIKDIQEQRSQVQTAAVIERLETVNKELMEEVPADIELRLPHVPADASEEEKLEVLEEINEKLTYVINAED